MHETFLYPFTDVKSKYTQRINQRSALKQNIIFTDCKIGHYRHSYIEICMHSFERGKKLQGISIFDSICISLLYAPFLFAPWFEETKNSSSA